MFLLDQKLQKLATIFVLTTTFFLFNYVKVVYAGCMLTSFASGSCPGTNYCEQCPNGGWCATPTVGSGGEWCLVYCSNNTIHHEHYVCDDESNPCSGGCFTSDTPISTPSGQTNIQHMQVGDQVVSVDEQTKEQSISIVEKIYEATREAYYKIKLKDGNEIKVTGEHPLYAQPKAEEPLSFWQYLKTQSITSQLLKQIFYP